MVLAALSSFVFMVGFLLLIYNGYVEDADSPPAQTLDVAIPVLIAAVGLMTLAVWRARSRGPRVAVVRLGLGVLSGVAAFLIGVSIVFS